MSSRGYATLAALHLAILHLAALHHAVPLLAAVRANHVIATYAILAARRSVASAAHVENN